MSEIIDEKIFNLSAALKAEVADYELESFAGFFTHFIKHRPSDENGDLNDFYSKLKDYQYLIALNASAKSRGEKKISIGDPNIKKWSSTLRKIKGLYQENSLGNLSELEQTSENRQKVTHYLSFQTYFENGALSYMEQDLDRLKRIFEPYNERLIADFGFDANFLVEFYRFSEMVTAEKHKQINAFAGSAEFSALLNTDNEAEFEERLEKLPPYVLDYLDGNFECSHVYFKFSREEYYAAFPKEKIDSVLDILTYRPQAGERYLFFAQANPLDEKPIMLLPSGEYLFVYQKQVPIAIGNYLYKHLQLDIGIADKVRKHRDKSLEEKTKEVFKILFRKEDRTFIYSNYHSEKNTEQDLLILSKNAAFIIEVKASKYREPFRNPSKGFDRLKSDFKESIQYGYEQCLRIEQKFRQNKAFPIMNEKSEVIYQIDPKKFTEIYSIIVTLERFGPMQSDLKLMLEKEEANNFPWAVYIDDLEAFILALKKIHRNPVRPFKDFLRDRSSFHGRAMITDELDVCGTFLSNPKLFREIAGNHDASATFMPENQQIFDDLYHTGLGFEDELFIEVKQRRKPRRSASIRAWS
jgi:hypothetical protein